MTINEMIKKFSITLTTKNGKEGISVRWPKRKPGKGEVELITANKDEILTELKRREAEKEAEYQAEIDKIKKNVPGLDELRSVINEWEIYHDKRVHAMETGRWPAEPKVKVEEIASQYPVAAAYIKAESYVRSNNHKKYAAGVKAKKAIENGEDYKEAIDRMEAEWTKAAQESIWN